MSSIQPDPYRTLGLARGATEAEVKRAYRALAKRHHPDAGDGSVVRFLEIQAAYEVLVGGPAGAGTRNEAPAGDRSRGGAPATRSGRPWTGRRGAGSTAGNDGPAGGSEGPARDADGAGPGEDSAGRDWARRPRGGSRRPAREARPGAGTDGPSGGAPAGGRTGGPSGGASGGRQAGGPRAGGTPPGPGEGSRARRQGRRRATLGSTSYDEAEEVFEPGWGGAAWYGPSSGTYWTLNPKEYADPRKHGPEYQARARRRAPGARGGLTGREGAAHEHDAGREPESASTSAGGRAPAGGSERTGGRARAGGNERTRGRAPAGGSARTGDASGASSAGPGSAAGGSDLPPAWQARPWTASDGSGTGRAAFDNDPPVGEQTAGRPPAAVPRAGSRGMPARGATPADEAMPARGATPAGGKPRSPGPATGVRLALATAAWLAPGFGVLAAAGSPAGFLGTLPFQVLGVVVLVLAPRIAWAALGGGAALAFAAIPIVALVTALGGPFVPGGPAPEAAVVLAGLAWLAGVLLVGSGRVAPFPWRPASHAD